jgi:Tfp pilus assembly protein PilO
MPPGGPGAPGGGPPPGGGGAGGKQSAGIKLTTAQQQNIAAAVLIVALAGFVYVKYLFLPVNKNYSSKVTVLEQKKKELKDARDMVSNYSQYMAEAAEINRSVDFINRRLPQEMNISDTISELTKRATECNINIVNFTPGKETNKGDYKEFQIDVGFDTNYRDLGNFLTQIGYIERLTTPANLSIVKQDAKGAAGTNKNIKVTMSVKIYSFVE